MRITVLLLLLSVQAFAQRSSAGGSISLKKRLHVNTLITEPGTAEVDYASAYSFTSTGLLMPTALKYTPAGRRAIWGRTEYSLSFNIYDRNAYDSGPSGHFGQSMTLTGTCVVHDGDRLDIAIAPQITAFLRDESGARLGATAITRFDVGRNSLGATVGWNAATHASPTNPAGTFDLGLGAGRRLAASGFLGHFTPHANAGWERSTGVPRIASFLEGVEYQITEPFAFDISAQQIAAYGLRPDRQIIFGITANLGHPVR